MTRIVKPFWIGDSSAPQPSPAPSTCSIPGYGIVEKQKGSIRNLHARPRLLVSLSRASPTMEVMKCAEVHNRTLHLHPA